MKVYVVLSYEDIEGGFFEIVCATQELAEEYIEQRNDKQMKRLGRLDTYFVVEEVDLIESSEQLDGQ